MACMACFIGFNAELGTVDSNITVELSGLLKYDAGSYQDLPNLLPIMPPYSPTPTPQAVATPAATYSARPYSACVRE